MAYDSDDTWRPLFIHMWLKEYQSTKLEQALQSVRLNGDVEGSLNLSL